MKTSPYPESTPHASIDLLREAAMLLSVRIGEEQGQSRRNCERALIATRVAIDHARRVRAPATWTPMPNDALLPEHCGHGIGGDI